MELISEQLIIKKDWLGPIKAILAGERKSGVIIKESKYYYQSEKKAFELELERKKSRANLLITNSW